MGGRRASGHGRGRWRAAARGVGLVGLGWLVGLALALPAPAAEPPSRERELEEIRLEITRLHARLGQVRGQVADVAGQVERTGLELELQEKRVAEAATARDLAASRSRASAASVAALEAQLEAVRAELRGRMLALYRLGRPGYLRLFLALEPGRSLLPAIRQLRFLARRDADLTDRYVDARARLAVERDELAAQEREAQSWVAREEERRRELDRMRREQTARLARFEGESRRLESRAGELAERERKLSNFLDFLYGRAVRDFRGVLERPVPGRVLEPFGPRLDPRYGTRTPHRGVDLETTRGEPVHAVYAGHVAFAAPFEGYGPTVILQHAGGVFTLYAGLGRLRVARGDVVALRQVLGEAADRLYFEIRVDNRPEDPLSWTRR
jgi:septal ring factor EnvC (AmiA/AmiB activator)